MTIYPFTLQLGPIALTGYGLMMMVAFLMAGWAMQLDLRRRGLNEDYAADIIIAGVIGGLLGAKLWYVLLTGEWDALLRRGGFVWYGGFLGATAAILLNGWRRRVPTRFTMEICAAPLALGYALGRVGCFLVNDDYGIPSSLPWAMKFPEGLPSSTVANLAAMGVPFPPGTDPAQVLAVHPTQLYETLAMFLVFWWLWRRRDHAHGTGWLFAWYLVFAGAERFLVEIVRAKDDRLLGPFTLAQATSMLLVVVGLLLVYRWRQREVVGLQSSVLSRKPAPAETRSPMTDDLGSR
ncbi:MAG: prolipoprotein diacylglyceryl transferase [Gemmatimonadales bacterium]